MGSSTIGAGVRKFNVTENMTSEPEFHAWWKELLEQLKDYDPRAKVSRADLEKVEYRAWNEYINVLTENEYEDLNPTQQVPYLAFWYDAEVQNGGHMQYFVNSAGAYAEQTVEALPLLGASTQARLLSKAVELVRANPLSDGWTWEKFRGSPLADRFWELDRAYYAAKPTPTELLERYLEAHFDEFIQVIEDDPSWTRSESS
jgi:hypothetical protein